MNEYEYIDRIDANFPYHDEREWKDVIKEGVSISDNAAYMALYEICSAFSDVPRSESLKMLEYWSSLYSHPTKAIVLEAANAILDREELPKQKILDYLDIIKGYAGFYNAAAIIYAVCEHEDETIRKKYDGIINSWQEAL